MIYHNDNLTLVIQLFIRLVINNRIHNKKLQYSKINVCIIIYYNGNK